MSEAATRALRLYPRSKGLRNTYLRGHQAAAAGLPIDRCPYPADPGKTWRAGWRAAWIRGWQSLASPDEPYE